MLFQIYIKMIKWQFLYKVNNKISYLTSKVNHVYNFFFSCAKEQFWKYVARNGKKRLFFSRPFLWSSYSYGNMWKEDSSTRPVSVRFDTFCFVSLIATIPDPLNKEGPYGDFRNSNVCFDISQSVRQATLTSKSLLYTMWRYCGDIYLSVYISNDIEKLNL